MREPVLDHGGGHRLGIPCCAYSSSMPESASAPLISPAAGAPTSPKIGWRNIPPTSSPHNSPAAVFKASRFASASLRSMNDLVVTSEWAPMRNQPRQREKACSLHSGEIFATTVRALVPRTDRSSDKKSRQIKRRSFCASGFCSSVVRRGELTRNVAPFDARAKNVRGLESHDEPRRNLGAGARARIAADTL